MGRYKVGLYLVSASGPSSFVLVCWSLFLALVWKFLVWGFGVLLFCSCWGLVWWFPLWAVKHFGLQVKRSPPFPQFVIMTSVGYCELVEDYWAKFDAASLSLVCTFCVHWVVGTLSVSHLSRPWYPLLQICFSLSGMLWLLFQIQTLPTLL